METLADAPPLHFPTSTLERATSKNMQETPKSLNIHISTRFYITFYRASYTCLSFPQSRTHGLELLSGPPGLVVISPQTPRRTHRWPRSGSNVHEMIRETTHLCLCLSALMHTASLWLVLGNLGCPINRYQSPCMDFRASEQASKVSWIEFLPSLNCVCPLLYHMIFPNWFWVDHAPCTSIGVSRMLSC